MGIRFAPDWKMADPWYTQKYGEYQAFLDSISQAQVLQAFWAAVGRFYHPWVKELLQDASAPQGKFDVVVEQGIHQTEDMRQGGFTLHFTVRSSRGRAFHAYILQEQSGTFYINEFSFKEHGFFRSDFRR